MKSTFQGANSLTFAPNKAVEYLYLQCNCVSPRVLAALVSFKKNHAITCMSSLVLKDWKEFHEWTISSITIRKHGNYEALRTKYTLGSKVTPHSALRKPQQATFRAKVRSSTPYSVVKTGTTLRVEFCEQSRLVWLPSPSPSRLPPTLRIGDTGTALPR